MRGLLIFMTLITLLNCKAQQVAITNVEWRLVKMGDTDLSAVDQPVTLSLDETNKKISGFAGCNRFFGGYQSTGATLSFTGLGSTKMFCQDRMNIEDAYFKALSSVQAYKIEGNKLYLLLEDKVMLEFSKEGK